MNKRTSISAGIPILLTVILVSAFALALSDQAVRAEEPSEEAEERSERLEEEA